MSTATVANPRKGLLRRLWHPYVLYLAILLVLAMVGMGVATSDGRQGRVTWLVITAGYAVVGVLLGWHKSRQSKEHVATLIGRCILHWSGLLFTLIVLYAIERLAFIPREGVADVMLLLLGMASFFAGLHLHWLFFVAAAFLGIMAYVDAYFSENIWIIGCTLAVFSVAAVGILILLRRRGHAY
jgi:hypothetical protein